MVRFPLWSLAAAFLVGLLLGAVLSVPADASSLEMCVTPDAVLTEAMSAVPPPYAPEDVARSDLTPEQVGRIVEVYVDEMPQIAAANSGFWLAHPDHPDVFLALFGAGCALRVGSLPKDVFRIVTGIVSP